LVEVLAVTMVAHWVAQRASCSVAMTAASMVVKRGSMVEMTADEKVAPKELSLVGQMDETMAGLVDAQLVRWKVALTVGQTDVRWGSVKVCTWAEMMVVKVGLLAAMMVDLMAASKAAQKENQAAAEMAEK